MDCTGREHKPDINYLDALEIRTGHLQIMRQKRCGLNRQLRSIVEARVTLRLAVYRQTP
jgi:hypothetical protein